MIKYLTLCHVFPCAKTLIIEILTTGVRNLPWDLAPEVSISMSTQSIVTDATNSCGLQWAILSQNRRLLLWMQNNALICYMVSCKWKQMSSRLCKRWPLWGSTCPCKSVHFWKPRFKLELVCELDIAENVFPLFCFHFYIYTFTYIILHQYLIFVCLIFTPQILFYFATYPFPIFFQKRGLDFS